MVPRYIRKAPPMVFQHPQRGQVDCWARALSSWISAVEGDLWTPDDVLEKYQNLAALGGMLDFEKHMTRIATDWRMETDITGGAGFTPAYVYEKLAPHSYVYMIFPSGGSGAQTISHAVVVYGISNANDPVPLLHSMDPMRGYPMDPFSMFECKRRIFTAWRPQLGSRPELPRGPVSPYA